MISSSEMVAGSFSERVTKMWDEWQIRVLVLLSLFLQMILIVYGNKRKYTSSSWIGGLIWISYLSANWVATVALSILSTKAKTNSILGSITPFWAPFLILHLGGPDTITAYSLEDNELWLRHLLQLIVQVGVAFYVFIRSWKSVPMITFLAMPVFIPGILKYGERIWVLRSASIKHFRDALLPAPESGPDYAAFMEEYNRRIAQGLDTGYGIVIEPAFCEESAGDAINPDAELLQQAYFLLDVFKRLHADLILDFNEQGSSSFLSDKSPEDAFKLIDIELGIMFDTLYTKTSFALSRIGTVIRCINVLLLASALVSFSVVFGKHKYSDIDIIITYLLLVGATLIEVYAGFMLLFSERTLLFLSRDLKWETTVIYRMISSTPSASINRKRWSGSMAQHNLLGFCLKERPSKFERIQRLVQVHETMEKIRYKTREEVTPELKEAILRRIKEGDPQSFIVHRGYCEIKIGVCLEQFRWSSEDKLELDQSILLWHIATNLCYYRSSQEAMRSLKSEISKNLSDYMLYLLVMRPLMLPKGIGEIRYRDTCAETTRFIQQRRLPNQSMSRGELCRLLVLINTDISPNMVKGDRSKSVLFNGCVLAKSLEALVTEKKWENEEKWNVIMQIWVEMLCYAAIHCSWNQHAQQLTQGGELLSHVCLLMAHLGISEQYQISAGHARCEFTSNC